VQNASCVTTPDDAGRQWGRDGPLGLLLLLGLEFALEQLGRLGLFALLDPDIPGRLDAGGEVGAAGVARWGERPVSRRNGRQERDRERREREGQAVPGRRLGLLPELTEQEGRRSKVSALQQGRQRPSAGTL
jgi:MYXO-CTERM domain-containing protein